MKGVPRRTFERFLKGKGIDLANYNPTKIVGVELKRVSTFKNRADEIKLKYNHQFKFRTEIDWRIFENINKLTFKRI